MPIPLVIGIAGGSGSGKTTLVNHLLESSFASNLSLLPHDAYYRNSSDLPPDLRRENNWDHPDALDNQLFVRHIDDLTVGRSVNRPVYDFTAYARSERTVPVEPRSVIILEGILRDASERDRTLHGVLTQYLATVRPMHEQFVEPCRAHAHLVVPWTRNNSQAVEVLLTRIMAACEPTK